MAAANQSASRNILPKLIITATAAGGTIFACHHLENQRRVLDDGENSSSEKSDGCTTSTLSGALSSLQSEYTSSRSRDRMIVR